MIWQRANIQHKCKSENYTNNQLAETVGVSVTLCTRIRELLGSNLGQDNSYLDWSFPWLSTNPPGKRWDGTSFAPRSLPPKSSIIHPSYVKLPSYWKRRLITPPKNPNFFNKTVSGSSASLTIQICSNTEPASGVSRIARLISDSSWH
jgi:hypothetical protein